MHPLTRRPAALPQGVGFGSRACTLSTSASTSSGSGAASAAASSSASWPGEVAPTTALVTSGRPSTNLGRRRVVAVGRVGGGAGRRRWRVAGRSSGLAVGTRRRRRWPGALTSAGALRTQRGRADAPRGHARAARSCAPARMRASAAHGACRLLLSPSRAPASWRSARAPWLSHPGARAGGKGPSAPHSPHRELCGRHPVPRRDGAVSLDRLHHVGARPIPGAKRAGVAREMCAQQGPAARSLQGCAPAAARTQGWGRRARPAWRRACRFAGPWGIG